MEEKSQNLDRFHLDIKGVKSLIFDIGGIILDDSDQTLWNALSLDPDRQQALSSLIYGPNWKDVMTGKIHCEDYIRTLNREHPEYAHEIEFALGAENFDQSLPLYQPNLELLKSLHETGKYKMYWLSNMHDIEYQVLAKKGIIDLLDGGAYSCMEHCAKPDPEFYQILFDRYAIDPAESVFFDDRERNIEAGKKLGMKGEVVPSLAALASILKRYQ